MAVKSTGKNLVIVESPSKAKTIGNFLGSRYKVVASVGHLRDLPKSRLGVDIEDGFEPEYINVRGKADLIKEIKSEAKKAGKIYLATDPDREGEAISWHLCTILGIEPEQANRIEFNEITKPTIQEAVKHPRPVDLRLVDAQQGRRVIDRVVGFKLSPLLWNKVKRGLSAGRVQSAALKIIVDREREIRAFVPKEYWNISADLSKEGKKTSFAAKLEQYKGKKLSIKNKAEADKVLAALTQPFTVAAIQEKEESRKPYPPYVTSTMMQDASVRIGFSPEKTRRTAQQLYEGLNIKGHGHVSLVTYIRTDSVRVSDEADAACRSYIQEKYSKDYLGNNRFGNKNKGTQDAHEAIRPSHMELEPDSIKDSLTPDQYKLYKLIWNRFVASRMKPAVYHCVSADIACGDYTFRSNGRRLTFEGYLKVYSENSDEKDRQLPALAEGEVLNLVKLNPEQKFTEGPSRFTEAGLIKELEEKGIGRPSTYASIVTTLSEKRYVKKEKKSLVPTDLGFKVTEIMEEYFKEIVDAGFTAVMEEKLDEVAEGSAEWRKVVGEYYDSYIKGQLDAAADQLERVSVTPEYTGENCPECGKPLVRRQSRFGEFTGCSGYPGCRYIKTEIESTGVSCPKCGKDIIKKRSRRGKTFYGCSGYPDCDTVFWYKPVNKACPSCGSLLTERGRRLVCSDMNCGYSESATSEEKGEQ